MHLINKIQNWTQNGASGNDKQVAWLLPLVGAGIQAASAYQASRPMETQAISPGEIRGHMAPVQGVINQMKSGQGRMASMGQQMMDPTSSLNQQQYGMMQEQGANQMALQSILQNRQNAATGVNSGIMQAQQRAQQQNLSQNLGQQYQNMLMQNRTQGMNMFGNAQTLLGNIGRMQTGVSENIAQAGISQRHAQMAEEARQMQAKQAMWGAVGGGLSGIATGLGG